MEGNDAGCSKLYDCLFRSSWIFTRYLQIVNIYLSSATHSLTKSKSIIQNNGKRAFCHGRKFAFWEFGLSMGRAKRRSFRRNFLFANLTQIGNGDQEPEPDQECGLYVWIVSGYVYECAWAISNSTQLEHARSDLERVKILNIWVSTSESPNKVDYQDGQPCTTVDPLHWDLTNPLRSCNTVWSRILGWGNLLRSTRRHQERMIAQQWFYNRRYK